MWIKRLADFNAIYSFHESIAVDSTFYHFYRKFYCPKVTYWEQGQKVGFKRCRPKKKKSSMRDFYCKYAHFWFLFLGGLECVFFFFFLWVGWNQEVLSLYWSRGDVQQSFLSWILERLHDLTVLLLGGLLLVLFSFFVCTFHFLNNPNACNIAKKKSHLLMNLPENIWRRLLSSLRPPAVYLKRKKKKMYIFRSVIGVIFLVTYTRDSSSSFFPPLIWSD